VVPSPLRSRVVYRVEGLRRIFQYHDLDRYHPARCQSNALGRCLREVDDAALACRVGPAIIDPDDYILPRAQIRDLHFRPQGK
jgi:hypothetical protein